ncbi:UDP-N-acetylglucosamine 1-carboxyvinyltransferase [bacterium]|nr:UDP-N-acetylglucosamine 1-carboxyvinyltransferase [bacterium]
MDKLVIHGGRELNGEIQISGAKNATLPLMAATLLGPGIYQFTNVPGLKDVRTMSHLLRILGARVIENSHSLTIDTSSASYNEAPYELVKTMRASFYVLGPLVARQGEARVSLPGGCAWGPRPVDLHLKGLEALGAEIQLDEGYIVARAKRLKGAIFEFPISSVGASGNILMAAVLAEGETILKNVALEPEITHLAHFLNSMGARIDGVGTRELTIQGVEELHPADAEMIPDRIETGSFLFGVGLTGGEVVLTNAEPSHLTAVIDAARRTGLQIELGMNSIRVSKGSARPIPITVTTEPFPGFPTDLQAPFMAQATLGNGVTTITDGIFSDRFTHVAELARLGADIRMDGATAIITGVKELKGAPVMSTDLRASVCLVLAGLAAKGCTEVKRIYHLDRGYEKLEDKLSRVGASITREEGDL